MLCGIKQYNRIIFFAVLLILILTNSFCLFSRSDKSYDLTVVGFIRQGDGIGKVAFNLINMLKKDIKINFVFNHDASNQYIDVPKSIKKIIKNPDKTPAKISISTGFLWNSWNKGYKYVPDSKIKLAYSMIESDALPPQSVTILNSKFDAVIVPDEFQKVVYSNSGVKIPIFVLPMPLLLDDFLAKPVKIAPNVPFTFGTSAVFEPRKNHALLLDAFAAEFGNNPHVKLRLHGRFGFPEIIESIRNNIKLYNLTNVEVLDHALPYNSYVDFMSSLDCYVFLSKGEGFSMTPRESMALGIPCILSNNTAHITMCKTGLVKSVEPTITRTAYYATYKQNAGMEYDCSIKDVRAALRDVYSNYKHYLSLAAKSKNWVQRYQSYNLKQKYLAFIKPKKIILGKENKILNDNSLSTNSSSLFRKYNSLIKAKRSNKVTKKSHAHK